AAHHAQVAAVGLIQAGQQAHGRGLATAAWPDQPEDRPIPYLKAEIEHTRILAENAIDMLGADDHLWGACLYCCAFDGQGARDALCFHICFVTYLTRVTRQFYLFSSRFLPAG